MAMPNHLPHEHEFADASELLVLSQDIRDFVGAHCPPNRYRDGEFGSYQALSIKSNVIDAHAPHEAAALNLTQRMRLTSWPDNPGSLGIVEAHVTLNWDQKAPSLYSNTMITLIPPQIDGDEWYQDRLNESQPEFRRRPMTEQEQLYGILVPLKLRQYGMGNLVRYETTALSGIVRALRALPPTEIRAGLFSEEE